jgi:hypothetical protein
VAYSTKCVTLLGLISLGGERSMSVKVPRGTMKGKMCLGENATG